MNNILGFITFALVLVVCTRRTGHFFGFTFVLMLAYRLAYAMYLYTRFPLDGKYASRLRPTLKQRVLAAIVKTIMEELPLYVTRRLFVWSSYLERVRLGMWGGHFERRWCRVIRAFDASEEDDPWGAYLVAEDATRAEVGHGADAVILYAHGGGFSLGGPLITFPVFVKWLNAWRSAHNANVHIVSLKYALSPEHAYPAQRNAFVKCYRWLVNDKGINPSKIFFAGDSAGGNMSITSVLHILHNPSLELPTPAGILAVSPAVTASMTSPSWKMHLQDDAISGPWFAHMVGWYDPNPAGAPGMDPGISPLLDDRLEGMPRMWSCAGEYEVFRDDLVEFVRRARNAGVDATAVIEKGQLHDYAVMWAVAEHGAERRAIKQMGVFLFGEKAVY